ncbi:efflux RND transporter permease subunit [Bacteroides helcogenes]|uniref:Acriflavin resistance protein n=1 Tax=Bacteroides helcogenes (strain ATCC 35417 / DSM 20613 / JCM 6297 / CCUG 15421 / P 36-108) TaxID=693979 RepID=E6SRN6_BACT6|nr:efflux RND transporter permease subunit [Bacteroides helcogenes]ADV45126.1 acriflavin resistance protein [Bacteroides helcogenes P 36-108]MDY5238685.1 efflux RND transporter permease subunit [Bacteroides helcogenes]
MNPIQKQYFHQVYSKPILFIGLLLLLAGIFCYTRMQTNLFPEVLFPRITVIADAGQQPVDRMMITVTKPLESAVKKVQGVTIVKSSTSRGSCVVEVYFKWGLDIYALKTQLESRINEIKGFLPPGTVISTEAMNQSLFPVYGYTLESKTHSRIALRDVGNLVARPVFSQVNGISNVVVRGGKAKEFVIIPDAAKMSALRMTTAQIKSTFEQTNFVMGNGNVADYNRLYLTLTDTRINDLQQLENTIVHNDGLRTVHLKDIARVEIQEQQEFLKINADGNDAVLIDLVKQPGVNLIDFAQDVETKAAEVRAQLPPGYELKPYYNQSAFVDDSIHSVMKTIYEGLLLAIAVMVLFLRSWRASVAVLITIPVTVAFSILLAYLAGISINVMSLGAIAASVGLIIDDAIVIIEQIYREHEERPGTDRFTVVHHAITNLFPAMVASSMATIVIHFPFRLMSGLAGSFFKELSDTMQLTMVASFLVTWLLLPVLHLMIGYKKQWKPKTLDDEQLEEQSIRKVHFLTRLYRHPPVAATFVLLLGSSGWWASTHLNSGFLPDLDEGTIVLDYHSPVGTDIEETDRLCRQMEKLILAHPDVATYSRRTALGMSFKTRPSNFGDYLIQLKKKRSKSTPEVISELRRSLSHSVPAMTIDFGQRITDLLGDLMSTPKPIEVKIFGTDQQVLEQVAAHAEKVMQTVPGIVDIDNGLIPNGPSLVFLPDEDRLSQFGISLIDFQEQLSAYTGGIPLCQSASMIEPNPAQAAMTGGLQIGSMQDGEQMRRILLRFTDFADNSPEKLRQQLIFLPDGSTRPLGFFCQVKVIPGEVEQRREDLKSNVVLTARLENRDLGSTVQELKQVFTRQLPLPEGCSISYGGAYSEQQQSFLELMQILGLATLLVFAVLMCLFKEWAVSLAVLFISVLGICGSLLALWIMGVPLNVSSYTGIIMIVGIIAENSIFTVHQYRMNRRNGGDVSSSVDYAIALRIRPKLMTAIGAVLALMPLALGFGMGAQMQQPLAVAVIGGFVVALPLLLIVLPSLMMFIYKRTGESYKK